MGLTMVQDRYGICVGDAVMAHHFSRFGIGRVVKRLNSESVRVMWPEDTRDQQWYDEELYRVCRNCHKLAYAHTDDGRCLFGATEWA